jgi:N-acetylglutamate synthase-like GNAT family acetyltransferase
VVTDYATFAYLADVFVDPHERHQGYGTRLVAAVLSHGKLQGLRRWHLVTRDAQPFYRRMAFCDLARPEGHMEKYAKPDYGGSAADGAGGETEQERHED